MKFLRLSGFVLLMVYVCSADAQSSRMQDFYMMNDSRISKFYMQRPDITIPEDFTEMLNKNRAMIADSIIPLQQKIMYQQRLIRFLESANREESFARGRYTDVLRYNLFLIKWTEQKQLQENILYYPLLSIRALPLYADESKVVSLLLDSFAVVYPDEVLRSAEYIPQSQLDNVLSRVARAAPESVKRHYTAPGKIKDQLLISNDPVLVAMRSIYKTGSVQTRAYYLLDAILKQQMSSLHADSLTDNKNNLFALLTEAISVQNVAGRYSINKELEYISVGVTRSIGMKSGEKSMSHSQLSNYSKTQLFALLVFGYKELFAMDITFLEGIIARKTTEVPLSFFQNLPKQAVSDLVKKTQESEKLEPFLKLAGEQNRIYLSSLLSYETPNDERQPLDIEDAYLPRVKVMAEVPAVAPKKETTTAKKPTIKQPDKKVVEKNEEEKSLSSVNVSEPEEIVEPIHFEFTAEERKIMQLKQNVSKALQNISSFINEPYAKEVLLYAATVQPDEVLQKSNDFRTKFFLTEVLECAAKQAPVSAKRYLTNPAHLVTMMLNKSDNPYIKTMLQINEATKFKSRPYLLIDQLTQQQMSVEEAIRISEDQQLLFKVLVRLVAQKNYIGKYSIEREFSYYALRFMREINDKIGQPDNIRFASLNNFSNDEIYFLTVYGREEVFSSTFVGIFNRYEMSLDNISDREFKRIISLPKWRTFIALCAANGKLGKLLSHFSPDQREELLHQFVAGLDENDSNFDETIMVSETVASTDDKTILQHIERHIKQFYLHCDSIGNTRCMATYGILAGLCKDKATYDPRWFKMMAKKYQAAELTTLRFKSVEVRNVIVEQMFFYDDEDGRESYQNFLSSFRNSQNWKTEEYFSYVKIASVVGKRIEIYANKPSFVESGNQNIQRIFTENNYSPSIIIHRGHSFHTEASLEKVPESAKFVFIGSCGGFYKASIATQNAPGAHIIATRQIGTKHINDPLIFAVNEAFREGKDIEWPQFWDKMKSSLGNYSLFYDYVPPHKNIESLFQQAYYKTLGL